MFVRLFSILFGSLVGTVIILSVIYEYGVSVKIVLNRKLRFLLKISKVIY